MPSILRKGLATAVMAGIIASACGGQAQAPEVRTVTVSRGAVTQTVAVSGSVNAAAQVRLNFKTGGRLAEVYVSTGQQVTAGQPLAKLDTSDLEVSVAQSQASLARAQASYDALVAGATPEDVALARQAVDNAQRNLDATQKSGQNDVAAAQQTLTRLKTNFTAARTTVAGYTTDIRTGLGGLSVDTDITQLTQARNDLNAILNANGGNQFCTGASCPSPGTTTQTASEGKAAQASLSNAAAALANAQTVIANTLPGAIADYAAAADALVDIATRYEAALQSGADTSQLELSFQSQQLSFNTASPRLSSTIDQVNSALTSAQTSITSALASFATTASRNDQSYSTVQQELVTIQQALTSQAQTVALSKTKVTQSATSVANMTDAIGGAYVQALQNVQSTSDKIGSSVQSAQNSLATASLQLQKTTAGPKSYDIAASYAGLLAAQADLAGAQNNLANATLRAPSPGVVASVANQIGETVGTAAAGFIVLANTTSVALHGTVGEADVAKLNMGQVATVTIDAVGTARMTGKITSLDPVATIQQGVPVYGVDVTIDVPAPGVRPGMSGTANVIIASKQNTLTVPNLAVKNQGGRRYVTLLKNGQQVDTDVQFGIANDTVTEVLAGLSEGDTVVLPQPRAATSGRPVQIGPGGGPGR